MIGGAQPIDREDASAPAQKWKPSILTWLIVTLGVAGLTIGIYPTAASWVASYNQSQIVGEYATQINHVRPDAATQLALAREYNEALTYGVIVSAEDNIPVGKGQSEAAHLDYWDILKADDAGLMARIRIPGIDVDLPVYHGTSDEVLNEGAGHLQGSHFPVGGEGTRTVITAHRGLPDADMFNDLGKLVEGDRFTVETFGEVLTYEVVESQVIEPHETDTIRLREGRDLATLITCTPLGLNTHRIVVTGERVIPTPQEDLDGAGSPSDLPHFPWWSVILVVGLAAISWYLIRQGKRDATSRAGDARNRGDEGDHERNAAAVRGGEFQARH